MIGAFKKLWPQRAAVARIDSQEELEKYITMELNDELTHPRVRKSKQEKLDFALARIEGSELMEEEKDGLRALYKKIAAQ